MTAPKDNPASTLPPRTLIRRYAGTLALPAVPYALYLSSETLRRTDDPTLHATAGGTFAWSTAADVRFVRGPLEMVDVYATNASGTLVEATSLADATTPAPGSGLYYLFAPDCQGRSYQNTVGAEPDRDLAAFP